VILRFDLCGWERRKPRRQLRSALLITLMIGLFGCSYQTGKPMKVIDQLDLPRFMGDWHVLADIATPFDRNAVLPLERYKLVDDNIVETIYQYHDGSPEGPIRERHLKGFVSTDSNAIWGMQIIWPIKADYRVVYLDDAYQTTIIGRVKRDFVWVMARTPTIASEDFEALLNEVQALGYDLDRLRIHEPMRSHWSPNQTSVQDSPPRN